MPSGTEYVRLLGAGSTRRRNTGVKSLCWGFKLQGLRWSFVWLTSWAIIAGRFSTTIRSPISSASLIEWVMNTAVLPLSLTSRTNSARSRPAVGGSYGVKRGINRSPSLVVAVAAAVQLWRRDQSSCPLNRT